MSNLSEQCQILGSAQSTIAKRRAALKQVASIISNSSAVARKFGKEPITASINYLSIIDAAANLIATDRAAAAIKYKGEQFDSLRLLIECFDRHADQSLFECPAYNTVVRILSDLIGQYWGDTSVDEFMPRVSHCFCSMINQPSRANTLSVQFLIQAFQYHGAALISIIQSKDVNQFVTNAEASDITPFPLPSSFFAHTARASTACCMILRSHLDDAAQFFESAFPVIEALLASRQSSSSIHPAFTFAATADLLVCFAQSIRFHHPLIVDVVRKKLPTIIQLIASAWPRQHISSRSTIVAKHSCASIISWALHLHLSLPDDQWPCFESHSCVRSLGVIFFEECHREEFLVDPGIDGSEVETLGSTSHSTNLTPHVQELLRSAIYLLLKSDHIRDQSIDGWEADTNDEADSSAPRKRRRISLMSDVSSAEPSPSKLTARSNSHHVPTSLMSLILSFQQHSFMGDFYYLHFISLLHNMTISASFLFLKHVDKPFILDLVIQHIKTLALKGKSVNRIAAFSALSALVRAFCSCCKTLSQDEATSVRTTLLHVVSTALSCTLDETELSIARAALELLISLLDSGCGDELDLASVMSRLTNVCKTNVFVQTSAKSESIVKSESVAHSIVQFCDELAFTTIGSLSRALASRNDGVENRMKLLELSNQLMPTARDGISERSVDNLIDIMKLSSMSLTIGMSRSPVPPRLLSSVIDAPLCEFDLIKLQSSSFNDLDAFSKQAGSLKWVKHVQQNSGSNAVESVISISSLSTFMSACFKRAQGRLDIVNHDFAVGISSAISALSDLALLDELLVRSAIVREVRALIFDIIKLCLECLSSFLRFRERSGLPAQCTCVLTSFTRLLTRSKSGWINFECSNQADLQQTMARMFGAVEQLIVDALPDRSSRDVVMLDGDMDVEFDNREPAQPVSHFDDLIIAASELLVPCIVHGFRANSTLLGQALRNVRIDQISVISALLFTISLNDSLSRPEAVWSISLKRLVQSLDSQEVMLASSSRRRVLTLTPSPAPRRQTSQRDGSCTPDHEVLGHLHVSMFVLKLENLLADCGLDPPDFEAIQTNAGQIFNRFDALKPHPSSSISSLHTLLHLLTSLRGLDSGVNEDSNAWARPTAMFDILEKHSSLTCRMIAANGIPALIERATDQTPAWLQTKDRLHGIITSASEASCLSDLIASVSCLTACCVSHFDWESQCLSLLLNVCASQSNAANHFIHSLTLTSIKYIATHLVVTSNSLLETHMSYILGQMLSQHSVKNLPIRAFTGEAPSDHLISTFCKNHLGALCVAILAATQNPKEEFERLASLSGASLGTLFAEHLPALTATYFALQAMPHSADQNNATASSRLFFESVVKKKMVPLLDRNRVAIIVSLCELCASVNGAPSLVNFSTAELKGAVALLFQTLAHADNQSESISSFLTRPNLNVALHCLLSFRSHCVAETRQHRFCRWLKTLRTFLDMIGNRIVLIYLARAAVDLTATLVFHPCDSSNTVVTLLTDIVVSIITSCGKSARHGEVNHQELASLVSFVVLVITHWASLNTTRVEQASQLLDKMLLVIPAEVFVSKFNHLALLSEIPAFERSHECTKLGLAVPDSVEQVFDQFIVFADLLSSQPHSGSIIVAVQQLQIQAARKFKAGRSETPPNTRHVFALLTALSRESSSDELRLAVCGAISELGLLDIQLRNEFQILEYFQPVKPDSIINHSVAFQGDKDKLPLAFPPWFARWYRVGDGLPAAGVSCKPFTQVPQFHKHLHFHSLCLQLLILGIRSSVPEEAWAAYRTLTRLFASQECTEASKHAYQLMPSESQVALAPFFTLASAVADLKKKEDLARMLFRSAVAEEMKHGEQTIRNQADYWSFDTSVSVSDWLVGITRALLQTSCSDHVLKFLDPCLTSSPTLAEHILPFVVFDVLQSLDVPQRQNLAASINRSLTSALSSPGLENNSTSVPMQCMATIIRCINYAREQQLIILRQPSVTTLSKGVDKSIILQKPVVPPSVVMLAHYDLEEHIDLFLSEIDLLALADVAVRLGRPATALAYTETWLRLKPGCSEQSNYHALLLSIYRSMDDSDGIGYASLSLCSSLHSSIEAELVVDESEQRWDRALAIHNKQHNNEGITRSLRLMHYTTDQPADHSLEARDRRAENAWRDALFESASGSGDDSELHRTTFNIALYRSLSLFNAQVHSKEDIVSASLVSALQAAQSALVRSQTSIQHERPAALTPFLVRLQIVRAAQMLSESTDDVERVARARQLFETFHERTNSVISAFDQIEQLPAALTSLFRICSPDLLVPHLRAVSALARQAHRPISAIDAILTAERLISQKNNKLAEFHLRVELARQAESEKEIQRGVHALKLIDRQLSDIRSEQPSMELPSLKSEVNWLIGEFSHAQNMDNPQNIDRYFTRALSFSESTKLAIKSNDQRDSSVWLWRLPSVHDQRVRLYRAMGDLHDRQFQALHQKNISTEFQRKRDLITEMQETINRIQVELDQSHNVRLLKSKVNSEARQALADLSEKQRKAKTSLTTEQQEIEENERHMTSHVKQAFTYYHHYLFHSTSSKPDTLIVYRFCALLFDHHRLLDSKALKSVSSIPCYVFLPLVYQIASRLNSPANEFQSVISSLIEQLCIVHPYHTYAPVFALSYGDHTSSVGHGSKTGFETNRERIAGARNVIQKLKDNPKSRALCSSFERTVEAYIAVGGKEYTTRKDKTLSVEGTPLGNLALRDQRTTHIPTVPIAVRPDGNYDGLVVHTRAIDKTLAFASTGVNRPLIVTLLGSDGLSHKLLVKPSDDLRQDAVMEQVFTLLNERLASRSDPRINRMRMRNYTIVPLTPGVGLVEFVNNSMTVYDCLVEPKTGAHPRHRAAIERQLGKKILDNNACVTYMRDVHMNHSTSENRVQLTQQRYDEICANFPPVFARALVDLFPSPAAWIRARGLYTRSLACSSMVGYILSIGDRHPHNILIDSSSAELIHIDFGIAFDMGKALRTPELVPFRLTRDLVDGLGITGTDGEFRQACERTLSLLRENSSLLDTVLDVFVHDPLYRWSTSNTKQHVPDGASLDVRDNVVRSPSYGRSPTVTLGAERAINGVRARLRGDDPTLSHGQALSVAGQVSGLIQQATDPKLLSKMYFGWSAWM